MTADPAVQLYRTEKARRQKAGKAVLLPRHPRKAQPIRQYVYRPRQRKP